MQPEMGRRRLRKRMGAQKETERLFSVQATTTLAPPRIDPPPPSVPRLQFLLSLSLATDDCDGADSGEDALVPASDTHEVGGSREQRPPSLPDIPFSPSSIKKARLRCAFATSPPSSHILLSLSIPHSRLLYDLVYDRPQALQSTPQPPAPTS